MKFIKKMAVCLNILLVVQLASLALTVPAGAVAAEDTTLSAQSIMMKAGFDQTVTAGKMAGFTLQLNNTPDVGSYTSKYEKTLMVIKTNAKAGQIASVTSGVVDRPFAYNNTLGIATLGDVVNGSMIDANTDYVEKLNFVFNAPGKYQFTVIILDHSTKTPIISAETVDVNVAENVLLSTTLPSVVKMGADVPFTATLDNSYGANHKVAAALTIKNAVKTDITKLTEGGLPVTLTDDTKGNLVATFTGSISNGSKLVYNMVINFAVDKTFAYSLDLVDTDTTNTISSYLGSIYSDGLAPVLAMTPNIINDVTKDQLVTFTGNEQMTTTEPGKIEVLTNAVFTQGSKTFTAVITKVSPTVYTAVIPANTITPGTSSVNVAVTFYDSVGNKANFAGVIAIDTVAPLAVSGLTVKLDDSGSVVLSWTNPNAGTFDGIRITRDGVVIATLTDTNITTYTDTSVEKGKTYSYVVEAYDLATNITDTTPVSISVPAPVVAQNQVAAVSTDTSFVAAPEPTKEEVKAESTENKKDDTDSSKKNNLPIWGIILLLILAGVGGYLFFTDDKAPVADNKKKNTKKGKK